MVSKGQLSKKISALRTTHHYAVTWEDVKKLLSDNLGLWTKEELKESYEKDLRHRYDKAFSNGEQEMVKSLYAEDEL